MESFFEFYHRVTIRAANNLAAIKNLIKSEEHYFQQFTNNFFDLFRQENAPKMRTILQKSQNLEAPRYQPNIALLPKGAAEIRLKLR